MDPDFFQIVKYNFNQKYLIPGQWVFFEFLNENKKKYWLMKTYRDVYMFGLAYPVSFKEGLFFLRKTRTNKNN
ncbi:hypothetical protein DN597_18930 [Enterobacter cloacae]|jgi:hypothetical protein|nr:hypothetical protein CIG58_18955 [Klebsiella oxytoca]RWS66743.1 hypothetical protein DN597_18930 [Enterobacter cloacae]CAF2609403.1 hypothetical protein AI2863V1_4396 [Klebsiella pneumoniae]CAH5540231.1 hypothetical protein AI2863V1_4396 [Klebsiella pneumoniae]SWU24977.1 Uncharacterised protein [Klebsiella pneumoniae]